jgi:hypothetical protein
LLISALTLASVCPDAVTRNVSVGACLSDPFLPMPVTMTDNCATHLFRNIDPSPADNRFPPGNYTYAFTLVDRLNGGNQAFCQFPFSVVDLEAPTIGKYVCPSNPYSVPFR